MKRFSSSELARGFLNLRQKTSHAEALKALAAALISGKISHRLESVVHEIHRQLLLQGTSIVDVVSAHELSGEVKSHLAAILKKLDSASRVEAAYRLDQSLIGGFTATTPEHTLDASVASLLQKLSSPLHV